MARRQGLPWAPTSLPILARQLCAANENAIESMRERIAAAEATGDTEWLHTINPQGQSWVSLLDSAVDRAH